MPHIEEDSPRRATFTSEPSADTRPAIAVTKQQAHEELVAENLRLRNLVDEKTQLLGARDAARQELEAKLAEAQAALAEKENGKLTITQQLFAAADAMLELKRAGAAEVLSVLTTMGRGERASYIEHLDGAGEQLFKYAEEVQSLAQQARIATHLIQAAKQ